MPEPPRNFFEGHPLVDQLRARFGVRFIRCLGCGGFNEVWKVEKDEANIAIKISLSVLNRDAEQALTEELEIAKSEGVDQHPNIVKFLGRLPNDYGYLVTCWELGTETLLDMLNRALADGRSGLSWEELLDDSTKPPGYMLQVAQALDDFANMGHHHRDIKPENLFLFGRHVKLGDLGLAKRVTLSTHRTRHLLGTVGYRPPEALRGEWTRTSDLYSAVATYVKLRTGREPFGDPTNEAEVYARQLASDPDLDGLQDFEIGPVRYGLAPNPDDRPQDGVLAFFQMIKPGQHHAGGKLPSEAARENESLGDAFRRSATNYERST